jgi:hypothetical protein
MHVAGKQGLSLLIQPQRARQALPELGTAKPQYVLIFCLDKEYLNQYF